MKVAALYGQVELVVLAYASEKSETLVSEGHYLHDDNHLLRCIRAAKVCGLRDRNATQVYAFGRTCSPLF